MNDEALQAQPSGTGPAGRRPDPRDRRRASASARPSSGARTSSSTPTPCGGSCGWPASGAQDTVVEVGPGLGSLTLALLPEVGRVVAVEVDPMLAAALPDTVAAARPGVPRPADGGLRRRAAPCARCPTPSRPPWWPTCRTTSRCPSSCTFLEAFPTLQRVLVMVQLEVAERLAAGPGSRTYGVPERQGRLVRRRAAGRHGQPQRVLAGAQRRLRPGRARPAASRRRRRRPREDVFACIDAAFAQRRKTLRAALAGWAGGADRAEEALRAAGIDPRTRGEQLDIDAFAALTAALPTGDPPRLGWRMTSAAAPGRSVTVRVPAKVNLELLVGPRRDDGYHDLSTVFHAVSSTTTSRSSRPTTGASTVTGPYADLVPVDGTNLALRAARGSPSAAGVDEPVHITIHKDIPVAGGMAGGSADAAADARRLRRPVGPGLAARRPRGARRRPRQRRAVRAARRHGDGLRARRAAGAGARTRPLPLGLRPQRRRPVHAGRLRRVRPAARRRAGARPAAVRADDDGAALRRRRRARPAR